MLGAAGKRRNTELLLKEYRVSVLQNGKSSEMYGADGCTKWMYPIPLNCIFLNGYYGKLYLYVFYTIFKKCKMLFEFKF